VSTGTDPEAPDGRPQCFTPGSRALSVAGISSLKSIRRMAEVLEASTPKYRSPYMSSETAACLADEVEQSTPKYRSPYMSSETAACLADEVDSVEAEAEVVVDEDEIPPEEADEVDEPEEELPAESPVDDGSVPFPAPQTLAGGQRPGRRLRSRPLPGVVLAALRPSSCTVYLGLLCCPAQLSAAR
jgi:hypothetical protein